THITETEASRRIVADLAGREGIPQIVLQVGIAPENTPHEPTPRRSPAEFLTFPEACPPGPETAIWHSPGNTVYDLDAPPTGRHNRIPRVRVAEWQTR